MRSWDLRLRDNMGENEEDIEEESIMDDDSVDDGDEDDAEEMGVNKHT